jgi:hypothetical protein
MEISDETKKVILDETIKNHMIFSYDNNVLFKVYLTNVLNTHYLQNSRFHLMWLFFHSFSFAYPEEPSEEYKMETANFIANVIPQNLASGCGGCQNDYRKYIARRNIFRIVSSKQELSTFFVDLHNYINNIKFEKKISIAPDANKFIFEKDKEKIPGPVFFNYEDVKSIYEQTNYVSLLEEKFNINIFNLIDNQSLSLFYDDFNKINFKIADVQYNVSLSFT